MSKIFELFGHRLDNWTEEAKANCQRAMCPFMGQQCDGGGNRYSSGIEIAENSPLAKAFPGIKRVQSGVCSLQLVEGGNPWIVCPRRLLTYKNTSESNHQAVVKGKLKEFIKGTTGVRVWSEVKMKIATVNEEEDEKSFDYTFDYIVCGSRRASVSEISKTIGCDGNRVLKIAKENSYTLTKVGGLDFVDDYPGGEITIIEIMTSSTSGGDRKKRTQVAMAFEDAVLKGKDHNGPGINYRQVWARMVSQLIVKSEVAIAWNGKTIWVIQDVLSNYISDSTALDLQKYISDRPNEVNILSCGYGESLKLSGVVIDIPDTQTFSGPISTGGKGTRGFIDIVRIGAPPPVEHLYASLFKKKPGVFR